MYLYMHTCFFTNGNRGEINHWKQACDFQHPQCRSIARSKSKLVRLTQAPGYGRNDGPLRQNLLTFFFKATCPPCVFESGGGQVMSGKCLPWLVQTQTD